MGLGGALNSGVSGIRAHQNMLDVIGNNLANINTYGYKSSRLLFSDLLSQTMSNGNNGNPMQVGKGVKVGSISSNYSQGTLETTNNALDFAIRVRGFCGKRRWQGLFTRVGSFDTDSNNYLIDSNTGYKVIGTDGNTITIPYNSTVSGKATSKVSLTGNLDASAASTTAEVVMTTGVLTSSSVAATTETTLNSLDSNTTDYVSGEDTILITGTKPDGTSVSVTFTYGTTLLMALQLVIL